MLKFGEVGSWSNPSLRNGQVFPLIRLAHIFCKVGMSGFWFPFRCWQPISYQRDGLNRSIKDRFFKVIAGKKGMITCQKLSTSFGMDNLAIPFRTNRKHSWQSSGFGSHSCEYLTPLCYFGWHIGFIKLDLNKAYYNNITTRVHAMLIVMSNIKALMSSFGTANINSKTNFSELLWFIPFLL